MDNEIAVGDVPLSVIDHDQPYRQLVDVLPAAVYMCDAAGRVTLFNQAAVILWGRAPELGEDLWCGSWRIYRPDGSLLPLDECPMAVTIREGRAVRGEHIIIERPDGTRRHVLPHPEPIFDSKGTLIGAFNMLVDVTEHKRVEAQAASALREADRRKDEFLAMLSHELRNPLNAMLGWTRMLRAGILDAQTAARALEVVERNLDHQNRLIADLLDVSRIAAGKFTIEIGPLDLAILVTGVIETMSPSAHASGIRLSARLLNETLPIRGDAERLRQMLGNLLSNALKFTPRGGRVEIELERRNDTVQLKVSDSGKGIAPEFLHSVFERFNQGDGVRTHGGLGLGLAIVRHIVEAHGGQVSVDSAGIGRGTTFTVNLPVAALDDRVADVSEPRREGPRHALVGLRVLVVEDHDDSRELIAEILRQQGATVLTVENARRALDAARRTLFDVMICDIGMPGDDGITLIGEIRSWPSAEGGSVPALALTGYARPEDRERALAAGFQMHLSKPAEPRTLVESVVRLSSRRGRPRPHRA